MVITQVIRTQFLRQNRPRVTRIRTNDLIWCNEDHAGSCAHIVDQFSQLLIADVTPCKLSIPLVLLLLNYLACYLDNFLLAFGGGQPLIQLYETLSQGSLVILLLVALLRYEDPFQIFFAELGDLSAPMSIEDAKQTLALG